MITKWRNRFSRGWRERSSLTRHGSQTTANKVNKRKNIRVPEKSASRARKNRPRPITTNTTEDALVEEQNAIAIAITEERKAAKAARDRETKARKDAPMRWDAAVDPSSDAFRAKYREFGAALRDPIKTTDGIINACFTAHEKAMLIPADNRRNPALHRIQSDNRARYQTLLKSERFKKWAPRAGLAFKFTLVYYGLPVAPMTIGFEHSFLDWESGSDDDDDDEDPNQDGRPPGGYLRFLNSYGVRHFGQCSLRVPDSTYENYYAFEGLRPVDPRKVTFPIGLSPGDSLSLRGGGDMDDMDIDDADIDDADIDDADIESETDPGDAPTSSMEISLRGGGDASQGLRLNFRYQGNNPAGPEMTPLYGFQGVVHFNRYDISSFADAVDRVMGLGLRHRVRLMFLIYDRQVDYTLSGTKPALQVALLRPHGYNDRYIMLLNWLDSYYKKGPDFDSRYALFVGTTTEPFPKVFEPGNLRDAGVMRLMLDTREKRGDYAYLRMPSNALTIKTWPENIYGPWMEAAARLLWPGKIATRPGRPEIPDAFFSHRGWPEGLETYGALSLPPPEFESLVAAWKEHRDVEYLRTVDVSSLRREGWIVHIPGYTLSKSGRAQYILYDKVDNVESEIESAVKNVLHPMEFAAVTHIDVWFPGGRMYVPGETGKYSISVNHNGDKSSAQGQPPHPLVQELHRLLSFPDRDQLQVNPYFIAVTPRFRGETGYSFSDLTDRNTGFFSTDRMPLEHFLAAVTNTRRSTPSAKQFVRGESSVSILYARLGMRDADMSDRRPEIDLDKPSFLITPGMTEFDFQLVWRKITSRFLYFDVVDRDAVPTFDLTKQPWGQRDIYKDDAVFDGTRRLDVRHDNYDERDYPHDPKKPLVRESEMVQGKEPEKSTRKSKEVHFQEPPAYPKVLGAGRGGRVTPNVYGMKPKPAPRPLSDQEKGRQMREMTWDRAPSVYTHMTIPINAPPVEAILRTGSDSVPALSLGVLTPTEQQKMRMDYYNIRNIALQRSQKCPYLGCNRVFKVSETDRLQRHLWNIHASDQCNFCDERLFKHWTAAQRKHHFLVHHIDNFAYDDRRSLNNDIEILSDGYVDHERESRWNFCSRCGRDHRILNVKGDRSNHDNICYPGATDGRYRWSPCTACGDWIADEKTHTHQCQPRSDEYEKPYCEKCALPLGLFTWDYARKHKECCNGRDNQDDQFCPWCGVALGDSMSVKLRHLRRCGGRPDEEAEGPISLETGKLWPAPVETVRRKAPKVGGDQRQKKRLAAEAAAAEKEKIRAELDAAKKTLAALVEDSKGSKSRTALAQGSKSGAALVKGNKSGKDQTSKKATTETTTNVANPTSTTGSPDPKGAATGSRKRKRKAAVPGGPDDAYRVTSDGDDDDDDDGGDGNDDGDVKELLTELAEGTK